MPATDRVVPIRHDTETDKQFVELQGSGEENLFYSDRGLDWEPHPDNPVMGGPSFGLTSIMYNPAGKQYAAYGQRWIRLPRPAEPSRGLRTIMEQNTANPSEQWRFSLQIATCRSRLAQLEIPAD